MKSRRWLPVVVLALSLVGCTSPTSPVPPIAPPLETPVVTQPSPSPEDLPTSGPPRTAVVVDHVLTYPDGRRVQLPREWGVSGIARDGSGYLVADNLNFEGTVGMHRLDARGRVVENWTGTGPALVGPDGQLAWVSMVAPESGDTGPTLIHVGERTQELDGIFTPYLQSFDGDRVLFTATTVRGRPRRHLYATDLVDPPTMIGAPPRRRYFSPSGENWIEFRRLTILIRTPTSTATVAAAPLLRTMGGLTWEDERHLLGTYVHQGRMAVARIDLAGRVSIASRWRRLDPDGFAFLTR